jgi:hypothetical protein
MGQQFAISGLRLPPLCLALAAVVFLMEPVHAVAQTSLPIVQARPDTGSRIRREQVKIFIPAEKPYDQLTPEQRAEFRKQFSNLSEGDEPSYPVAGLRPVAEAIIFALADGKVGKGALFMTVHVDAQGKAQSTAIYETPDSHMSKEVAAVLMKEQFKPATCSGKPCSSEFPFTARFDVE